MSRTTVDDLGERGRVGGVAGEHPHRHRPALGVGEEAVLDLLAALLAVAGVATRGQLAAAAGPPTSWSGRTAPSAPDSPTDPDAGRQLFFDAVLPANQPVHRGVDLVGGGVGHRRDRPRGWCRATTPAWTTSWPGGPPATRSAPARDPAPGPPDPAARAAPACCAIAVTAATCPCGSDRVIVNACPAGTSVCPFSVASIAVDRLSRQFRQVRQRLVLDLASRRGRCAAAAPTRRPAPHRTSPHTNSCSGLRASHRCMPSHVEPYRDHPRTHRSDTLLQWLHIQAGTPPSTQVRPTIPTENRLNFGLDDLL